MASLTKNMNQVLRELKNNRVDGKLPSPRIEASLDRKIKDYKKTPALPLDVPGLRN